MKIELTKWIIEKVIAVLNEKVKGAFVHIDDLTIMGVTAAKIEYCECELPIKERECGEEDYIQIGLLFEGGVISKNFYPDREVCEILIINDDGSTSISFNIQDTKKYVEREVSLLQDRLKDYEEYMSR